MGAMASQITSLTIVYSIVYSGADQSKHQSSASLAFVRGIHRGPVNSPHKRPVTRKMFPFDDVIMFCMPLMSLNILCRCLFCIKLPLCISYILHKELSTAKWTWNVSSLRYFYTQVIWNNNHHLCWLILALTGIWAFYLSFFRLIPVLKTRSSFTIKHTCYQKYLDCCLRVTCLVSRFL